MQEEAKLEKLSKLLVQAKTEIAQGNLPLASKLLADALDSGIRHADVFFLFGEVSRRKGLLEQSVKYLTQALGFENHMPDVYFSLGEAYMELKQPTKATKVLERFLSLVETPEGHFVLSKALKATGRLAEAAVQLGRAIELNPGCALYYANRGEVLEMQGFYELAERDYRIAMEAAPGELDRWVSEAWAGGSTVAQGIRGCLAKVRNAGLCGKKC